MFQFVFGYKESCVYAWAGFWCWLLGLQELFLLTLFLKNLQFTPRHLQLFTWQGTFPNRALMSRTEVTFTSQNVLRWYEKETFSKESYSKGNIRFTVSVQPKLCIVFGADRNTSAAQLTIYYLARNMCKLVRDRREGAITLLDYFKS